MTDSPIDATTADLKGKTALVTGSSRGIGRAIALGLAARGAAVAVCCRARRDDAEAVAATIRETGGQSVVLQGDLADPATVITMFDDAERGLGQLDIVVANAADALVKPVVECTEDDYEHLFAANVKSAFFTLREAARRVSDGGRIIATSTGGTRMFFTGTALYLGTKGAVEQFVRVLSRELGEREVTVNCVSPGFTETELLPARDRAVAADMSPLGRAGRPQDVAEVVVFLASEQARWVTGQNVGAGGGVF